MKIRDQIEFLQKQVDKNKEKWIIKPLLYQKNQLIIIKLINTKMKQYCYLDITHNELLNKLPIKNNKKNAKFIQKLMSSVKKLSRKVDPPYEK